MPPHKQTWPTTVDNPYDPFTQFDRWLMYDEGMGYNTCATVARLAHTSPNLTDMEMDACINDAIHTLVSWYAPYDVYRLAVEGNERTWGMHRDASMPVSV